MCSHSSAGYGSTVASDSVSAEHFLIWPLLSPVFALLLSCLFSCCLHLSRSPFLPCILSSRIALPSLHCSWFSFSVSLFHSALSSLTHTKHTKANSRPLDSLLFRAPFLPASFSFYETNVSNGLFIFFFCSLKWCHKVVERKDGDGRDDLEKHRWRGEKRKTSEKLRQMARGQIGTLRLKGWMADTMEGQMKGREGVKKKKKK